MYAALIAFWPFCINLLVHEFLLQCMAKDIDRNSGRGGGGTYDYGGSVIAMISEIHLKDLHLHLRSISMAFFFLLWN